MNVANKRDKKNVRQRTPPSELILFWRHVTSVFKGLSLSRSVGRVEENPGNEVALQALLSSAPRSRVLASLAQIGELARRVVKN